MGGNALRVLEGFETRRVLAHEYHTEIVPALRRELGKLFPLCSLGIVRSYADKQDFGDVDVLIDTYGLGSNWIRDVLDHFKPKAHAWSGRRLPQDLEALKPEGNAFSIEFRGFQVDLLPVRREEFTWTSNYYAFNDLGNLVGRIAHKMGLKFGHDGLWYCLYNPLNPTHVFAEIRVTLHGWDRALKLFGLDPARYHAGFDRLTDVFEYVSSSAYFNPDIFLLENRNHRSRTRDRKRKTYTEFLDWVAQRPGLPSFAWNPDKSVYLPAIFETFPSFEMEYRRTMERRDIEVQVQSRFNGDQVRAITGLQGEALGEHMRDLRGVFDTAEALRDFVLGATDEALRRFIVSGDAAG